MRATGLLPQGAPAQDQKRPPHAPTGPQMPAQGPHKDIQKTVPRRPLAHEPRKGPRQGHGTRSPHRVTRNPAHREKPFGAQFVFVQCKIVLVNKVIALVWGPPPTTSSVQQSVLIWRRLRTSLWSGVGIWVGSCCSNIGLQIFAERVHVCGNADGLACRSHHDHLHIISAVHRNLLHMKCCLADSWISSGCFSGRLGQENPDWSRCWLLGLLQPCPTPHSLPGMCQADARHRPTNARHMPGTSGICHAFAKHVTSTCLSYAKHVPGMCLA